MSYCLFRTITIIVFYYINATKGIRLVEQTPFYYLHRCFWLRQLQYFVVGLRLPPGTILSDNSRYEMSAKEICILFS